MTCVSPGPLAVISPSGPTAATPSLRASYCASRVTSWTRPSDQAARTRICCVWPGAISRRGGHTSTDLTVASLAVGGLDDLRVVGLRLEAEQAELEAAAAVLDAVARAGVTPGLGQHRPDLAG